MRNCGWLVLAAFCALLSRASATDYTWTGAAGDGDFTNKQNYADAESAPGENDTFILPADTTIYITNAAQVAYVSQFTRIHPVAPTSRIIVDVPEGDDWHIRCGISSVKLDKAGNKDFVNGELVKRGKGSLTIGEEGK